MVYGLVYIMLFDFINELFNFGINNIVWKPIIDKGLFYIFKIVKEDTSRRRYWLSSGNKCFYNCSFITERTFTLEIEGTGINVSKIFMCGGDKSVNAACILYYTKK